MMKDHERIQLFKDQMKMLNVYKAMVEDDTEGAQEFIKNMLKKLKAIDKMGEKKNNGKE